MIPDAGANLDQALDDLLRTGDGASCVWWRRTQSTLQGKVSIHHTIDGVLDLWMRGLKDLIEHVQIDAVALHVEFGAGQPEVKERHTLIGIDEEVARGQVAVNHPHAMQTSNQRANRLQQGIGASLRFEVVAQGDALEMFHHDRGTAQVGIEETRHREPFETGSLEDPEFRYEAGTTQRRVQRRVSVGLGHPDLSDRRRPEPSPGFHHRLRTSMQDAVRMPRILHAGLQPSVVNPLV